MMGGIVFLTTYCFVLAEGIVVFFEESDVFCFAFSPGALAAGSLGGVKSRQLQTT